MEKKFDNGKATFNLQRFQILQTKLNDSTSHLIHNAYAYAWYRKVFPLLDDNDLHEDLEPYFSTTRAQVDMVTEYADSEWLKGNRYTFYEYEDYFGIRDSSNNLDRSDLIAIFRYMFLKGGFDEEFWSKLIEPMKHPTEASTVTSEFNSNYIYLT